MNPNPWYLLPALLAGLVIPFQGAINARFSQSTGHPIFGALNNFVVGLIALIIISIPFLGKFKGLAGMSQAPAWSYAGGLFGATFVTMTIVALPKLGAVNTLVVLVAGQLVAASAVDHFGWLGLAVKEMSVSRAIGLLLVAAGVIMVTKPPAFLSFAR